MKTTLLLAAAALMHFTTPVFGQTGVGVAEQRMNRFQYHSTHNSYERDEGGLPATDFVSVTTQLDALNVWHIELDLRWHEDNDDFWIFHDCAEDAGNASLNYYLGQIANSRRATDGIIFLYFDAGDIGPCFFFPNIVPKPSDWYARLKSKLQSWFGSSVYTWEEFQIQDGSKWPSAQELLRRGKHIVPIHSRGFSGYLFKEGDVIFANTSDETTPVTPADLGDDKFARHYPEGWICSIADDGWAWSINNGYNFPSSNCSDHGIVDQLHPPLPTYVAKFDTIFLPERGTWGFPHAGSEGVVEAVAMIQRHQSMKGPSMIRISIEAGTYSMAGGRRITTAVKLSARDGTVRLE